MNPFKKFIIKSLLGDDFTDPNKAYSFLNNSGVGFGGYNFSTRKTKNFIKEGFVSNPDVFAVVSKIAQNFAGVKWEVKQETRNGLEVVTDSELNRVLDCPNQLQTWSEFQESAAIMYLLTGNTYINGTEAVGFQGFRELSVLPSQVTAPIVGNEITPVAGYEMQSTEIQKFTTEEVAHIKAFDPRIIGFETLIGLSPLEAAMFVYSANNEQWEAMASMLKNKGAMGIVTSRTDRGMRKDDAEDMQKQYRDTFGGGKNFGSPMFTGANVDFLQMGMSSTDLQMIEQGVLSLRAICNIYKVSSRLFNDPANSTFNNVQQAEKAMWNDAVIPLLEKFKQRYNSWLAPSFGEQYMLDYDLTGIDALQADAKTRAEVAKIHADSGSISVNEYRKLNGLELLDDESADLIPKLRENNQDNS
jgi:HK97 family phage portal protein